MAERDARLDMRMPHDIVEAIKKLAKEDERPVSKFVERILRAYVEAQKGKRK